MDMILSLPVMSYFLLPSTSYSTSLNLMFFYLTWSTLVLSNPPLRVLSIGLLASYVIFFVIPASLFLIFDTILPSLAVEIKIQGAAALPTRTGGVRGVRSRRERSQWYRVIGLSLFNICLSVAFQTGVEAALTYLQMGSVLKVTTTLPMPWTIVREVAQILVVRDVLQYVITRFILHPPKKNYLASLHRSYAHSITAPYAFTAHYDHPLPHFLHHLISLYLPTLIFRPHILTYLIQLSLTTLASTLTSSGYTTIPGYLLGGATRRCDMHFSSGGAGNYSSSGVLDWVCGTGVGKDVVDDFRDEGLGERGGKALRGLRDSGKEGLRSARRKSGRKG